MSMDLHEITVGNKKRGDQGEYIGRPSPLGNPFTAKQHGMGQRVESVEQSIAMFENWLNQRIEANDPSVIAELTRLYRIPRNR